jgi:Glycosyl hydrolase family 99
MSRSSTAVVRVALLAAAALALAACAAPRGTGAAARPCAHRGSASGMACVLASARVPVFAYYYMWMHGSYWSTNKLDHPVRPMPGNYDSADPAVIDWQMGQAKAAGISGFIVSWKDTATYRKILPEVEAAAGRDNFKLAMEYETLNASRHPLPASEAAADFRYFAVTYASDPAWYRVNGKALTIIDDSNRYTPAQVAAITGPARSSLTILGDVSTVAVYKRYAACTDGDAYYWSSDNPAHNPGAAARLSALSAAVHAAHGTWIAPFAPGFNATLLGGHLIVPRDNGATLRASYALAAGSSPDLLGLISWNEWTENTYVEPSQRYGYSYVDLLKGMINSAG